MTNPIEEIYTVTEKMLDMWEQDSAIDETELTKATQNNRRLHSKYLRLQTENNRELSVWRDKMASMRAVKRKHVLDGVTTEEYKGDKEKAKAFVEGLPKNSARRLAQVEQNDFIEGDEEIRFLERFIAAYENRAQCLKEIIHQINNTTYQIKNIMDEIKYKAGIGG